MDRKILDTKSFYNKYAQTYNEKRHLKGGTLFNEFIEIPATRYLLRGHRIKNKNVLDIGCGIGFYANYFSQLGGNVTAIDISNKMIEIAKENCIESQSIKFINDYFEEFNFIETYDIIIGGFMLSYFFDLKKAFHKINSIMSRDGLAVLSMLHPVKLSMISKSEKGFCIDNYFDENDYSTDLSFEEDEIELKKWTLEDISKAAKENNMFIDDFLEPKPEINIGIPETEYKFYHRCPSVISFKLKKRN